MIFIKRTFQFNHSGEIRSIGQEAGFIDRDDAPIVYVQDYVGFNVSEQLPDQAVENGISDALADQLGVDNPVYAYEQPADHPDYADKSAELVALYDGTHPSQQ